MTGIGYMILGTIIVTLSTIGFIAVEILMARKKRKVRESSYHIYG